MIRFGFSAVVALGLFHPVVSLVGSPLCGFPATLFQCGGNCRKEFAVCMTVVVLIICAVGTVCRAECCVIIY